MQMIPILLFHIARGALEQGRAAGFSAIPRSESGETKIRLGDLHSVGEQLVRVLRPAISMRASASTTDTGRPTDERRGGGLT